VWPTESSLGRATAWMGGHGSRRPRRVFCSLVLGPRTAPVPKRLLELAAPTEAGLARGDLVAAASIQGLVARYRGPPARRARFWFTRNLGPDSGERGLPATGFARVVAIPEGAMA